ncbi:MAG: lysophospholipase [Leptospiraceae bacterium]|nr:lysophospholipase [Leptospiraceae bacterium]
MAYTNKQSSFNSSVDKTKIFYQSWKKPNAKRLLVIQHGFGEHSDRYKNILDKLKDSDFSIYALDARGHGRSEGIRGHVDQFQYYVEDLSDLVHIALEEEKQEKFFLLGHSLGGVISLQYTLEVHNQDKMHGLIVSSPGLKVKFDFEKLVKRELAKIFANFLPSFVVDANIDINLLSHDKSVIEDYKNDPLNHGKISFQMANHLFHLSYAIYEKAKLLQIPILMIHGDADGIAEARGSIELDSHITSNKKTLKIYPGLYHELMNELPESREIVLNDIKKFLDSVVPEKL